MHLGPATLDRCVNVEALQYQLLYGLQTLTVKFAYVEALLVSILPFAP